MRSHGFGVDIVSWKGFDFQTVSKYNPQSDVVFFRTGSPKAAEIALHFEKAGFAVLNDHRYIRLSGQKFIANEYARMNGIPVPELNTVLGKDEVDMLVMYLREYGSLVAKPIYSRDMGRSVFRVATESDASSVHGIPGSKFLLQSEVKFEKLIRTVVTTDGMMAGATIYDTKHDGWKARVCQNPNAVKYSEVPAELVTLAEKTLRVFGGCVAYIDYFETTNGFVLSEINHSCGLTDQERITKYPIAERIASCLINSCI